MRFDLLMARSLGFGSAAPNFRPIQTRFRCGYASLTLNLAGDEQLAGSLCKRHAVSHGQPHDLQPLVGTWFQVLFHSPPGVLFTFPSRYWFAIGRQNVLSLRRWSSRIPTGFLVSRGTWERCPRRSACFDYTTVTFCGASFQKLRLHADLLTPRGIRNFLRHRPTTPAAQRLRP